MKLCFIGRLALAGAVVSSALAAPAATNAPTGARIEFATPLFDFGRVQSGKIVSHDFIFTNTGDQTLVISDIQSSCGCTAATNWDRRVEPGRTGVIPVLFNSSDMAGPIMKNLWIVYNHPDQAAASIVFTATIWKFIDSIPAVATFTFGPDVQTNQTRVIRLVSNLKDPVTLSAPECTNRSFKAELKTVQPGKEFELDVTVLPPLGPGSTLSSITLKSSAPEMPVVTVPAYALVQPALTVTPPRIRLMSLPLEEAETFVVKIKNNATRPVTLSEPAIDARGATVRLQETEPGKTFTLTIMLPAGFQLPAGQTVQAGVKSDHPQSPVVYVPVVTASIAD